MAFIYSVSKKPQAFINSCLRCVDIERKSTSAYQLMEELHEKWKWQSGHRLATGDISFGIYHTTESYPSMNNEWINLEQWIESANFAESHGGS